MLTVTMSLKKMRYDAKTGTVIHRSKMHLALKRDFQVMPSAAWFKLLCRHIPDARDRTVRSQAHYGSGERTGNMPPARNACKLPRSARDHGEPGARQEGD